MSLFIRLYTDALIDDQLEDATADEAWLWVKGLLWSKVKGTDGYVPERALRVLSKGISDVCAAVEGLVNLGLWHEVDGGYTVGQDKWARFQVSSAEAAEKRQQAAERQRRKRQRETGTPSDEVGTPSRVTQSSVTRDANFVTLLEHRRAEQTKEDDRRPEEATADEASQGGNTASKGRDSTTNELAATPSMVDLVRRLLDHQTQIGVDRPMTRQQRERLAFRLGQLDAEYADQLVEHAIESGWRGIPDKFLPTMQGKPPEEWLADPVEIALAGEWHLPIQPIWEANGFKTEEEYIADVKRRREDVVYYEELRRADEERKRDQPPEETPEEFEERRRRMIEAARAEVASGG